MAHFVSFKRYAKHFITSEATTLSQMTLRSICRPMLLVRAITAEFTCEICSAS
jgi:hypothetical protein